MEKNRHRLLVIDNYDSFTYNLVQMFRHYDLDIRIYRSDKISPEEAGALEPDYILISPGPKDPAHAGISIELIRTFYKKIPIFGVCLGMQCMNEAFGGETVRAPLPMHGKTSQVRHENMGIFHSLQSPFRAARYHSLAVRPPADGELLQTAFSSDGVIMGLSHPHYPLHGVQFHPESFLTEMGFALVENFLKLGPLPSAGSLRQAPFGRLPSAGSLRQAQGAVDFRSFPRSGVETQSGTLRHPE